MNFEPEKHDIHISRKTIDFNKKKPTIVSCDAEKKKQRSNSERNDKFEIYETKATPIPIVNCYCNDEL